MLYALFTIFASLAVGSIAVYSGNKLTRQLEEMNNYLEEKISERTESLLDTQKELLEDNTNLARLASTDPLTGLFNRNYMNDILQREYSRYQRYGQLFGIILIDVDHFKRVNDIHGHDVGDMVLTQVAQQLKAAVRNTDFVGRWGGEEFLICCSTTDTGDIEAIAENVRIIIAESEFEIVENLTVSLGCALIHPKEDIGSLIKRSDVALYEAKHGGRNQTKVSTADM
jgi:diguanylate cyclase (GGDEF)-like protein